MANVKFLTGNAASLPNELKEGQVYFAIADEINKKGKIVFDANSTNRYTMAATPSATQAYAICNSDEAESPKKIVLQGNDDWVLEAGSSLYVKFLKTNTASCPHFSIYKSDETTQLNDTIIPVFFNNQQIMLENLEYAANKDFVLQYIYTGSHFVFVGGMGDESRADISTKAYRVNTIDIEPYNLIAQDENGLLVPAATTSFLLGSPMYISKTKKSAGEINVSSNLYERCDEILLLNQFTEINGVPYAPLFLKGTINQNLFVPYTVEPFSSSLPAEDDGYCYLYIGETTPKTLQSGSHSFISLNTNHPIYEFKDGGVSLYGSSVRKLSHTLTIGEQSFDGSADVVVPIYGGDYQI